jgi:hypothetical protein
MGHQSIIVCMKGRSNGLMEVAASMFEQYFHGTRADPKPGDLTVVGHNSHFRAGKPLSWVYFSGTLVAAIWGAELAVIG